MERIFAKDIYLRLVTVEDAAYIFSLRTDPERAKYLSPVSPQIESQIEWLRSYKERERLKQDYYFVVYLQSGKKVGLIRLYDLKPDSFCWGSWIVSKDAPMYAGIESAMAVYDFGFYHLGFKKARLDVMKNNLKVLDFHKRFGAQPVNEDTERYFMELPLEVYKAATEKYSKFYQRIKVEEE